MQSCPINPSQSRKHNSYKNYSFFQFTYIILDSKHSIPLEEYLSRTTSRNEAVLEAFVSSGYTQKQLDEHFSLHYLKVSRIVSKGKTCPFRFSLVLSFSTFTFVL
ncbi:hypothetical protein VCHA52P453_430003 [Vibrio chagasii]|nr:hypothetical protein VCHA39P226_390003 [Vibrio chagasii]CAH7255522.1 hypothetical protein VCHA52P456_300003 [Vibrio chagasii]CAH7321016.1 hypothetical protein VCHA52P453_430003 [Vibrio chagasii]